MKNSNNISLTKRDVYLIDKRYCKYIFNLFWFKSLLFTFSYFFHIYSNNFPFWSCSTTKLTLWSDLVENEGLEIENYANNNLTIVTTNVKVEIYECIYQN